MRISDWSSDVCSSDLLDARVAGDVVDRLFRVERRALAADHRQGVDHVAAELQHAALEDREKADRPGAYDGDISGEGLLRQATSPVIGCALVHESRAVAAGQDALTWRR